jgi:hypothetical protein
MLEMQSKLNSYIKKFFATKISLQNNLHKNLQTPNKIAKTFKIAEKPLKSS